MRKVNQSVKSSVANNMQAKKQARKDLAAKRIAGRGERRAAMQAAGMTGAEAFQKRRQAERKAKATSQLGRVSRALGAGSGGGMKKGGMAKAKKRS